MAASEMTSSPCGPASGLFLCRVGRPAPPFDLRCVDPGQPVRDRVRLEGFAGHWLALIFYPRDFSFVCPTELAAFSARMSDFRDRDCAIVGVSVDDVEIHERWLRTSTTEGGVRGLRFPLASDPDRQVACAYGVEFEDHRVAGRGLFIIDPAGILQYMVVHNLSVGRSTDETLRVLDALQEGGLCRAGWTRADGTIDPATGLAAGRVWGRYNIEREVGAGGFGHVWAAWDLLLERRVALKVGRTVDRAARMGAVAEARAAAQLEHPNVCGIYAVEEEDGVPLIVMEYLPGAPLDERLADGLAPDDALRIARQVVRGVAASHAVGVVHGDIKPANILFSEDGTAKVSDFGIARRMEPKAAGSPLLFVAVSTEDATLALPVAAEPDDSGFVIRGTPAYMAPEQASGAPATAASDVFTTGLLLFELLSGERAVRASTPAEALDFIKTFDPVKVAQRLPARLRADFVRILARDPGARPTMAEVIEMVERWSLAP